MAAKTNYFSHDAGARNDSKIVRLRMRHGAAGYGVYFMLLERLREENDYRSSTDYEMIAYELRVDVELIRSVVEDFGLFTLTDDGEAFYSESFCERMNLKDAKSSTRSEAGRKGMARRWTKSEADTAEATPSADNSSDTDVITNAPENNNNVITNEEVVITKRTSRDNNVITKRSKPITSKESKESKESKGKNDDVVVVAREAARGSSVATSLPAEATPPTAVVVSTSPPDGSRSEADAARLRSDLEKLQSERLWVQTVRMNFAINDDDEWRAVIAEFYTSCIAQSELTHESPARLKAHFTNWLRIYRAAKKREQNEENRRIPTKRETNRRAVENLATEWQRAEADAACNGGASAHSSIDLPC